MDCSNCIIHNQVQVLSYSKYSLNKGFGLKFWVGSWVWHGTSEEGRKMHWPKYCEYNNKGEDNSSNTLSDKNIIIMFQIGLSVDLLSKLKLFNDIDMVSLFKAYQLL